MRRLLAILRDWLRAGYVLVGHGTRRPTAGMR